MEETYKYLNKNDEYINFTGSMSAENEYYGNINGRDILVDIKDGVLIKSSIRYVGSVKAQAEINQAIQAAGDHFEDCDIFDVHSTEMDTDTFDELSVFLTNLQKERQSDD